MSETKHTPGPWEEVPQNGAGPMIAHRFETGDQMRPAGLRLICHMLERGNSLAQDKANARLISAAPDYAHAAGLAITALSFALERAQREGDELAFAQINQAKQALIDADNKRTGRGQRPMIDVTPRPAAITQAEGQP